MRRRTGGGERACRPQESFCTTPSHALYSAITMTEVPFSVKGQDGVHTAPRSGAGTRALSGPSFGAP